MLRRRLFANRDHVHPRSRSRTSPRSAASLAVCENLEPRQLLTQFTFPVPQNEGAMIIDYSGSSPIADIDDLITSAYNGGQWTGNGLGSSTAAGTVNDTYKTAVGFAEASETFEFPLPDPPPTFEGTVPDDTMVLVKYTWYGDANLSGEVGLPDFNRVAGNFGQSPRRWVHGDFNFDNTINLADFNRLAANFGQGGLGPGDGQYQGWDLTWEELMEIWEELTS